YHDGRMQYVYLASELTAAGAGAGNISSFGFNITSIGSPVPGNLNIKIGTTSATTITALQTTGMTTVYSSAAPTITAGWNIFPFLAPFVWNGSDNIVIEVCFDNSSYSSSYGVEVTNLGSGNVRTFGYYADNSTGCAMTSGNSA